MKQRTTINILPLIIGALAVLLLILSGCKETSVKACGEYQLNVSPEGYDIFDKGRRVGFVKYGECETLDRTIDLDNQ